MSEPRVLMIGPGRDVKGGISTVVNNYFGCGLNKKISLTYLATMEDGGKTKKLFVVARAYCRFAVMLKKCDIVHVHMAAKASFDRKSLFIERAKRVGKKVIIHQHGGDFDNYFLNRVGERKQKRIRKIFAMADKVIVLSEEDAAFFGKNVCDRDKIVILNNGVPVPEAEKTDFRDRNVLVLGRLEEEKGIYDLLKAIPAVLQSVPDAMFYLCGDGEVKKCRKIADETGIVDHVCFLGWLGSAEKEKYLEKCSTFILPSYFEGMPMSLLEAMSRGLASIGTNVGSIPQVIENNRSGLLIKVGDTEAISTALISVLKDEELRKRLGQAGRECVKEKYDLTAGINTLNTIYMSLEEKQG